LSGSLLSPVGNRLERVHVRQPGSTALLLTLSFIAGMVDVTSFVLLHGVFAAHITGNIVVIAAAVATHTSVELTSVLAVVVFLVVTIVLTAIVDTARRPPYQWARSFVALQFGLLAAVAVVAVALDAGDHHGPAARLAVAVLAVAAMAAQNALLHLTFRRAPSTAVMTGNTVTSAAALVGIGLQWLRRRRSPQPGATGADADDHAAWHQSWPTLAGFIAGCLVGAAASEGMHWWAWVLPAAVAGAFAAVVAGTGLPEQLRRDQL
jgi:uncharacterized membrane protein YoaK (UPF0700 family)